MNPNDVSGEDDDDSDTEIRSYRANEARTGACKDDNGGECEEEEWEEEGDGEVEEEPRPASRMAMRRDNDECGDEDDDNDDNDEMPQMENGNRIIEDESVQREELQANTKATAKAKNNTLEKFLTKPKGVQGENVKEGEIQLHSSKKDRGKSTNSVKKSVQLIDTPVAARKTKSHGKTFNPHDCDSSEGGDDDDEMAMTLPSKPPLALPAPDVMQEYDEKSASAVNTTTSVGGEAPDTASNVDPGVHEYIYVVKNEKVNKFWEVSTSAFVYAPKPDLENCKELSLADITVNGKDGRIAAHTKLCKEEKAWVTDSAIIIRIATDGIASGTGPCMNLFMLAVPFTLNVSATEMDDMMTKLNIDKTPGRGHKRIIGLWPLDQKLVEREYKESHSKWPAAYNPNTNPSHKYKVPTKLEEQVKSDTNFRLVGPLEKASRARKRNSDEATQKAENKKQITVAGAPSASASATASKSVEDQEVDGLISPLWGTTTVMPEGITTKEICCDKNKEITLVKITNGKYMLIKSPV